MQKRCIDLGICALRCQRERDGTKVATEARVRIAVPGSTAQASLANPAESGLLKNHASRAVGGTLIA
jgi:hypothetical protein